MAPTKKIIAVASGGGHFIQLLRLRPAFEGHQVSYVTTIDGYQEALGGARCFVVRDASRWDKIGLLVMLLQLLTVFIRVRPDVVITTGAAPGVFAVRLAKFFCARTLWLDSIANAEEVSMSGELAGPYADLWLTQWPELERADGPVFKGRVL
ncbi:MAG: UDP-N-acetylglucosamine--LPS N-acetylglucosamine transferase [Zetaproteobacteria bacterium CG_4_9_14_3_um_filter_49_83]|nr:MAG: hypothetical protein AUJ56_01215 [Zetaproteobacteria bacterium CG1_02_49_23]PIQ33831.1 MAG: UDP-N-acetylglucosamine--LPS N-acetylglucosamine transferase [Zetaproteobacteria bacterium CG17_big_fil_post_rev_8_21_14_2_50_50_13]PIV30337.1 MAG: UDP-N-acetylglucosamine--LPS N-acetylglucosamine transferase [Zetaproteobacteria bacterium CG02_land_8_20_14_3_00_50_9]PIY55577.1 MAG: UDP-N-acetylglucosamine--LPS N-acetylglucosamine transferase [Zetaproteobacteria bacterium CG_4_10_14_0_8_um_filter_4